MRGCKSDLVNREGGLHERESVSLQAMAWAFKLQIDPTSKLVLLALTDHISEDGVCWVGMPLLMKKTCLAERTIRACAAKMEKMGILRRSARFQEGRQTTNFWEVVQPGQNLPRGQEMPGGGGTTCRGEGAPHAPNNPQKESGLPSSDLNDTSRACARKPFKIPAAEEVQAYAKDIDLQDWESFWDFYASNGWKVGRNPMKDWQAAARRWRRENLEKAARKPGAGPAAPQKDDPANWSEKKRNQVEGLQMEFDKCKRRVQIGIDYPKDYTAASNAKEAQARMDEIRAEMLRFHGVDPCKR